MPGLRGKRGVRVAPTPGRVAMGVLAGVGGCWGVYGSQAASGAVITPTAVWVSSYYSINQQPSNLINNSGLNTSSGNVLSYTHAPDDSANGMWHAGAGQGIGGGAPNVANQYIVLDLGANYDLTAAYLWQMVQHNLLTRGIKEFALYASSTAPTITTPPATYDLTGFTQILGTSILAMGTGPSSNPNPATTQTFTLSNATNVRQVYVDIISAWSGNTNDYVGLGEIKFEGTTANSEPPPPAQQYYWINPAGGTWQTGGNWNPAGTPTASDDVNFDLEGTYTVTLGGNASVRTLNISDGVVTIDAPLNRLLQAETINITGGKVIMPGFTMGAAGFTDQVGASSALNFTGGTIRIEKPVGFRPATGTHTVAGVTYTRSRVISGLAGSDDRPTLELANGAFFGVQLYQGDLSDGSVLVGINGGKGGVVLDGVSPSWPSLLQSSGGDGGGYLVIGGGGTYLDGQFVPGDGTLEVYNGGEANSSTIYIGTGGGVGSAVVDGPNSLLRTRFGYLYVGHNGINGTPAGSGSLLVSNGGHVSTRFGVNVGLGGGASGTMTVDNASVTAYDGYGITVGDGGTGTLAIRNGGVVTAPGLSTIGDAGVGGFIGKGTATIEGQGSLLSVDRIRIGHAITSNGDPGDGSLTITDGGTLHSNGYFYIGAYGGRGVVTVGRADGSDVGTPTITATDFVVGIGASDGAILNVNPAGFIEATGHFGAYPFPAPPASAVKINLAGGTIKTARTDFSQASYLNWTSGTLWYTGGTSVTSWIGATANDTLTVPAAGVLMGTTQLNARLTVLGTISPGGDGHETATFATRNLLIGSAGGAQGSFLADLDFANGAADLLTVTGSVNLANARLSVSLIDLPGELTAPVTFLLIVNDGTDLVSGSFANVEVDGTLPYGYTLDYAFSGSAVNGVGTGNDVAITIVPEPSVTLLFAPAAAMLLRRRSRRVA